MCFQEPAERPALCGHSRCSSTNGSSLGSTSAGEEGGASAMEMDAHPKQAYLFNSMDLQCLDDKDIPLEMTPLEAFVTCFYEDLKQGRPLFLSQLNNLYRMRSGGLSELNYRKWHYNRMSDFLLEVAGVELTGAGNHMEVKVADIEELTALSEAVAAGLKARTAELARRGLSTENLEINFQQPTELPNKLLVRIWGLFRDAPNHEIPVGAFLAAYKEHYCKDKLWFKALGYQDVRGLLAQVPFIEKVGGRGRAVYRLKPESVQAALGGGGFPGGAPGSPVGGFPSGGARWPRSGEVALPPLGMRAAPRTTPAAAGGGPAVGEEHEEALLWGMDGACRHPGLSSYGVHPYAMYMLVPEALESH